MTRFPARSNGGSFARRAFARSALASLGVALLLGGAGCSHTTQKQVSITRLTSGYEPLKEQFNRDAGKVRLLLLLDPT